MPTGPGRRTAKSVTIRVELARATAARLAAAETMRDSGALIAQSRQALRHAAGTLRESDAAAARRAGSARGRTNLEFVAELWRAFETGGAAAIADLVPPDVEWRPLQTGGEDLRGTPGLREFWAPPNLAMPTPQMFQAHGDDVLVHAERRCPHGGGEPLWLLYRFDGQRLVAADAFDDEQAALAALMRASAA